MRKTSYLFLVLFSATSLSQNSTNLATPKKSSACFYSDAAKKVTGKWTATAWSVYGTMVYGVVPVVSEIVIGVITAKLMAPANNPDGPPPIVIPIGTTAIAIRSVNKIAEVINQPGDSISVGNRIALGTANLFRSAVNSGASTSPGLPVKDIITVGLFVTTLGAYVTEYFMQAHCEYENQ